MKDAPTFKPLLLSLALASATLASCSGGGGDVIDLSGSFDGWRQVGNANWHLEDGEFVANSGNGHLVTNESFDDFRITAEFFVDSGTANSGVYMRISDPDDIRDTNAYEANIFDDRPDQAGRTGGLVHFAAPTQAIDAAGQWNTYDITVEGDHIVINLNGTTVVDTHDSTHAAAGPISLQYGAGEVRFRNVRIQPL